MQFSKYEYTIKTKHKHNLITYCMSKQIEGVTFPSHFMSILHRLSQQIKLQNHEIKATYLFKKGNTKLKQCTFKNLYVNMSEQSVF